MWVIEGRLLAVPPYLGKLKFHGWHGDIKLIVGIGWSSGWVHTGKYAIQDIIRQFGRVIDP